MYFYNYTNSFLMANDYILSFFTYSNEWGQSLRSVRKNQKNSSSENFGKWL